jgi:TRAP-type mannitol/chloroaromatic compound transport system permease small subunit
MINAPGHEPAAGRGRLSFGAVTAVLSAAGTSWILVLMVLICSDVVSRGLFNEPILGVAEMVQFSIVGIVFLQLAETLRIGAMTRTDVLLGKLLREVPRVGHALQCAFHATGAALFAIIFATSWPLMRQAFANSEFYGTTGGAQIPIGPLKVIILIGCAAVVIQFVLLAWRDLRVVLGGEPPPAEAPTEFV